MTATRSGVLYAASAYAFWGLSPIYFKAIGGVLPFEVLMHRMLWAALLLVAVLAVKGHWGWLSQARDKKVLLSFIASAAVLSINWFVYIWAVHAGRVVDASFGYFISPLVSVVLGVVLLDERLRRVQWLAITLALAGVLWLAIGSGQLPWIGLLLAASFGIYGFLRKTAALGALAGLTLETLLLLPFAVSYLGWQVAVGQSAFVAADAELKLLLVCAGPVTAVPLLLFAAGARRIPLSLVGLLQYIGPALQLLLGVFVYHEPFDTKKLFGYSLTWLALALYSAESFWFSRQRPRPATYDQVETGI